MTPLPPQWMKEIMSQTRDMAFDVANNMKTVAIYCPREMKYEHLESSACIQGFGGRVGESGAAVH